MPREKRHILLFLFLSFVMISITCDRRIISPRPDTDLEEILKIEWTLQSFRAGNLVIHPPEDQTFTITFETDSTFSGRADCNDMFGHVTIGPDQSMSFERIITTEIGCGKNSMDGRYISALYSVYSFSIRESRLFLKYGKNSSLVFRKTIKINNGSLNEFKIFDKIKLNIVFVKLIRN